MAVNIKSARVDELLEQLRALTGEGPTEIVRQALEQELQRLRRLRRRVRLETELPALQQKASAASRPFDAESLYDADGLPA
jgi:hypothetical protein